MTEPSPQAVSLRECPFCGGVAEIIHLDDGDNAGGSCVCCTSCQASGNVEFGRKENFVENWNRRASPADGVVVPRGEVTDEWADRFCEAINWSPDGQECKVVEGEMRCVNFRQIAKGHILAAIATGPEAASPALAAETGVPVAWRWRYKGTDWRYGTDKPAWPDDEDEVVEPLYTTPARPDPETEGLRERVRVLEEMLHELLSALSPLTVMGRTIASLDTRLSRAVCDAVMLICKTEDARQALQTKEGE